MIRWRRLLPAPLASAALLALWLMLGRGISLGYALLGLGLALVVPLLVSRLRPAGVRVQKPLTILRFIAIVGVDVIASNLDVARGVVLARWRAPKSRFVIVPLELRDPVGLAVLSMVTTVVPGTVWSELALDRSALLLHVWDVPDRDAFIAYFKSRYERPLKEIFE